MLGCDAEHSDAESGLRGTVQVPVLFFVGIIFTFRCPLYATLSRIMKWSTTDGVLMLVVVRCGVAAAAAGAMRTILVTSERRQAEEEDSMVRKLR